MPSDSRKETSTPSTTPLTAVEVTPSTSNAPEASLPKLVMCFDISILSLQDLKTIASDLKVPSYSQMTKEQLCKTLLAL